MPRKSIDKGYQMLSYHDSSKHNSKKKKKENVQMPQNSRAQIVHFVCNQTKQKMKADDNNSKWFRFCVAL